MSTPIFDTIPVGKTFRIKGDNTSIQKGEQNQVRVFLRDEDVWVVYPRQSLILMDIEEKGVDYQF